MDSRNPKLTQMELARVSGVSQKTISNMLDASRAGLDSQTLDKLDKVAGAFGLTAWHMLIPCLPLEISYCHQISELVAAFIALPSDGRAIVLHTAERERQIAAQASR
jgi:transcriptional regulator with XRE-family HTH domain